MEGYTSWKRGVYCLALIFFPAAISICSRACECSNAERPCEYLRADVVFVGRVIETLQAKHFQDKGGYSPGYSMRFAVEESLRGRLGAEVHIETGGGGGDCGTPLEAGAKFLIFAYKEKDGTLWTGMCSGNRPLTGDPRLDKVVDEYRSLIAAGRNSIFGRVELVSPVWRGDEVDDGPEKPARDVVVHANSRKLNATTRSTDDGWYQFDQLPDASYTVAPEIDKGLDFDREYPDRYVAQLRGGQCSNISFKLEPNTRITGRVTTSAGVQLKGIEITAIPARLKDIHDFSGKWDLLDENGRFDLWPLPAGNYYLGININNSPSAESPFPPTYYPGVTDKNKATIVRVQKQDVKELELKLPEVAKPRTVHFVATGLDGRSMSKIYIQIEDLRHPGDASSYVNVDLDEKGAGTLTIYAGYSYHLHGSHWVSYGNDWCSKPVVIPAGTAPVDARFVMYRKDVSCVISETDNQRK